MKTFNNLKFKPHRLSSHYKDAKQATMQFKNGYGVSVIIGSCFYSNGINSYELAVTLNGSICYDTEITNDVLGYLSKEEVTEIMKKVQKLA